MEIRVGTLAVTAIPFGDGSHTIRVRRLHNNTSFHTQRYFHAEEAERELSHIAHREGEDATALFEAVLSLWTQPGNGDLPTLTVVSLPVTDLDD